MSHSFFCEIQEEEHNGEAIADFDRNGNERKGGKTGWR